MDKKNSQSTIFFRLNLCQVLGQKVQTMCINEASKPGPSNFNIHSQKSKSKNKNKIIIIK